MPKIPSRHSGFVDLDGDIKSRTSSARVTGRLARHESGKMTSRRRDELRSRMSSLAIDGGLATVDVVTGGSVSGVTAGIGAGKSALGLYRAHQLGKGGKELAKEAISHGLATANPWLGLIRDLAGIAQTMEPAERRRSRKLARARKFLGKVDELVDELQELKQEAIEHSLATEESRLQKAIDRLTDAKTAMTRWVSGKASSGSIPLLEAQALERLADPSEYIGIL